jgi:dihydrofolate synthase/folylpolyglutamate synthase
MLRHLEQLSYRKLHIVYGMVKDKDADSVLRLLPREAVYYFTQAHIPRALPAEELQLKANEYNLPGEAYDDVNAALRKALNNASKEDLILVCGSIFLVAEVNRELL